MEESIRCPETPKEWELYYDLRYRILREPLGKERGSERNEGDQTGVHFAYFRDNRILAVGRLDKVENDICQVRFVAVESEEQGKGIGYKLMQEVEKHAQKSAFSKIILHARDYALDFYLKQDYKLIGPSYKLFDVLQHYQMEKELD